jgi:DNA-binding CsgD family transcriptional regulator
LLRFHIPQTTLPVCSGEHNSIHLATKMTFWKRLLNRLRLTPKKRRYELNQASIQSLHILAEREHRNEEDVAADLLAFALAQREITDRYTENWKRLSEREQQITALICMHYTNQQIAERLSISPHTVKSHVRNISHKFGLTTKADLRQALANWDFSAWDH